MTAPRRSLTDQDVPIVVRDGTVLRATVTRPWIPAPVPVVLMRTPYPLGAARFDVDPDAVTARGLALVVVSHRGTGASDGDFEPWWHETDDGADVIAWCADQPWSTGAVVTHGRSYLAQTQLYAAGACPAALRAMAVGVCPTDPYDVVHQGGALLLGSALGWAVAQAGGGVARAVASGAADATEMADWAALMGGFGDLVAGPGPLDLPVLDRGLPSWRAWVEHPARDAWWAERALPERDPVPTVFVGGWHDLFIRGTLREFGRARHPRSRLVVGPWGHGPGMPALGEVDHGFAAGAATLGLDDELLDFLAEHASDEGPSPEPQDGPPAVRLHLMGAGEWLSTSTWPPPESEDHTLFLHADGRLDADEPADDEPPVTFVHDPAHPVPTLGGANLFLRGDAAFGTGAWDQRAKDGRDDVVRFTTEPLPADLDVVGVVRLSLVVSTTAADADWCAVLVDVHPDGRALNVVDGVVRARFAATDTAERLLEPGVPHRLEIEVGPTAQRFAAGHRLRLDLAGSNHPRFDVNPGTGGTWALTPADEYVVAHQSVHVDRRNAGVLTLPVLTPSAPPDLPARSTPTDPSTPTEVT